jgi:diguanylate cyclase (GGDEF)-like protein
METLDYEETTEDLNRRIFDLNTMLEIGKTILSNLSLKDVLDIVLLTCGGHFHSSDAIILILEDGAEQQRFIWTGEKERIVVDSSDPFVRFVKDNQGAHHLEQLKENAALKNVTGLLERAKVDLVIPLQFKGSVNGILCLKKKQEEFGDAYTNEEVKYAESIAGFASVAIENARLYEMATLDMKTRVYNHGFFKNRLIEEISRAERYKTDLILMMLDLDHFKKVNDTHGHMAGDLVLVKVADSIRQHVRVYDVPARFGGEEFSVVLPETSLADSQVVSERLRKSVENLEFSSLHGPFRVSVSIGVAPFVHAVNMTEDVLIERADRALYHAKSGGRNRVVRYDEIAEKTPV